MLPQDLARFDSAIPSLLSLGSCFWFTLLAFGADMVELGSIPQLGMLTLADAGT